jgi:hypothetical protein
MWACPQLARMNGNLKRRPCLLVAGRAITEALADNLFSKVIKFLPIVGHFPPLVYANHNDLSRYARVVHSCHLLLGTS